MGWCAVDKAAEHCRLCQCRGCLRLTAACADDAALSAQSDALAKISAPSSPPPLVKKRAPPVKATAPTGACFSTHEGDVGQAMCSGWCDVARAEEHCSWCKCRGCQRLADACLLTEAGRSIMEERVSEQQEQQQEQQREQGQQAQQQQQQQEQRQQRGDECSWWRLWQ